MGLLDAPAISPGTISKRTVSPLMAKLRAGTANACLLILGDSTGDSIASGQDRWPKLVTASLASAYPNYSVIRTDWNASTNTAVAPVTVSAGTTPASITDSFTRANAPSLGSTDTGQTWRVDAGSWSIASNKAVPASGARASVWTTTPDVKTGSISWTFPSSKGTYGDTSARAFLRVMDSNTYVMVEAKVNDSGSFLTIYTYIKGTLNTTTQVTSAGMAYSGSYTMTFSAVGPAISATVGTTTVNYTLNTVEQRSLSHETRAGFGTGGNPVTGFSAFAANPGPLTLNVQNLSSSGAGASYLLTYASGFSTINPDQVIINDGHNEFFGDARPPILSLVQYLRDRYPHTPVACTIQNPRGILFNGGSTPTADRDNGIARAQTVQRTAQNEGLAVIDVMSLFLADPNYSTNLLNSDQLHPNTAGTALWVAEVMKFLSTTAGPTVLGDTGREHRRFIPAQQMFAIEGTPALALTGNTYGWNLDPTTQQSVAAFVDVPSAWTGVTVHAVWDVYAVSGLTGSTNQVQTQLLAAPLFDTTGLSAAGQVLTVASYGTALVQTHNSTGNTSYTTPLGSGPAASNPSLVDLGRPLLIQVRRVAADANDTYAGQWHLLGIEIVRAA